MSNVPSPRLTAPPIVTKVMVDGTADEMLAKLGSMTAVPRALGTPPPGLDHRCGFLLTFIDGVSTIEDIIDACGLPKDEVVRILGELLMVGVVKT